MTKPQQDSEFEVEIEEMLQKVFRIIHEGVILHEYLTDKEYATLSVTLKNINPPLRGLRISQCTEEPLSTYALTQLLHGNITLEWFHIEASCIEPTGIKAIAEMLKQNNKLQQFHCAFLHNGLSMDDIQALSDMLLINTTLKDLTLPANNINAEKAKVLAATLAQNPALAKLNIVSNEIGAEGAVAIADALTKNSKLMELNLTDCRLGNAGMNAIFTALKQNLSLSSLTLRRLSADVIPTLADMIAINKGLKKLDLSLYTSELSLPHMQLLLEALKQNKYLLELSIQDDDGKLKSELTEIGELLKRNLTTPPPAPEPAAAATEAKADGKQPEKKAEDSKSAKTETKSA